MIPLEIAKATGFLLGIGTGIFLFLLLQLLRQSGLKSWRQKKALKLMMLIMLICLGTFLVENNRAPIVKRLRYRMERLAGAAAERPPVFHRTRISLDQGTGGIFSQPVYQGQIAGASLSFLFLLILTLANDRTASGSRSKAGNGESVKPLNIDKEEVLRALNQLMAIEKVYKAPDLSLDALASQLHVSRYQLSQLINEELHQNFYGLINQYRVEEAVRLMKIDEMAGCTLSAIGYEVGFNSKSSFYRAFKERTGHTPATFRKGLS